MQWMPVQHGGWLHYLFTLFAALTSTDIRSRVLNYPDNPRTGFSTHTNVEITTNG